MAVEDLGHGITYRDGFNPSPIKRLLVLHEGGECRLPRPIQEWLATRLLNHGMLTGQDMNVLHARGMIIKNEDDGPACFADHRPEKPCGR